MYGPVPWHAAHERVQEQVVGHRVRECGCACGWRCDRCDRRLGSDKEIEQVLERAQRDIPAPPPRAGEEGIP